MKARQPNETARVQEAATGRIRLCLASGQRRPEADLVRFVMDPQGVLIPDVAAKLPGRGLWVISSRECIDRAIRKKSFVRAAKGAVKAESVLADQAADLISRRCLNLLGLARRAGQITFGFEKVKAIRGRPFAALIEARDGSSDGRDKILDSFSARASNAPIIGCFTGSELGLALGRDYVVHAALEIGVLAQRFLGEVRRLGGFREICPKNWGVEVPENLIITP